MIAVIARVTIAQGYLSIGLGIAFAGICIALGLLSLADAVRRH